MSLPVKQGQMVITPHKPPLRLVYLSLIVAILVSLPWLWMLREERAQADKLLTEATMRLASVQWLTIRYANGARMTVHIKEEE